MKTHTSSYKENVKKFGRQLDSKIRYISNGVNVELGSQELNSVTPHYEGAILKSVMKQLDIDSNVDIPINTQINYKFGVLVNGSYEYINFGNYIVYSSEKQEDTNSYKIVCYDRMLLSMVDYQAMNITYPITIRNFINAICNNLGLVFKNASSTFVNYNKTIPNELFLDNQGNSLGYTFRDVLDQLAEVTASTICINEDDDKLEIRYINNTNDTINEEYLKDINVNFGEQFGSVNTVVLSRSAGADKISQSIPANLPDNEKIAVVISDNLIMNDNNRSQYIPDILNKLNGLSYYLNDFSSTGITYYNLCDRYNVQIGNTTYSCIMFNDEINVTQGLQENIHTDMPDYGETDYKKTDKIDQKINQTNLIVNKQEQTITALVTNVKENNEKIDDLQPTEEATGIEELYLPNSAGKDLIEFRLKGKSEQKTTTGKNLFIQGDTITNNGVTYTKNDDGSYNINGTASPQANYYIETPINETKLISGQTYTLSCNKTFPSSMTIIVEAYNGNTWLRNLIRLNSGQTSSTATIDLTNATRVRQTIRVYDGREIAIDNLQIMLEKGNQVTSYEQYTNGASPNPDYPQDVKSIGDDENYIDVVNRGKNLFNKEYAKNKNNYNVTINDFQCFALQLKPNTKYTISQDMNGYAKTNAYYYDVFNSDKTSIKRLQSETVEDNLTVTFTTGDTGVIYFGHIYGFSDDNRVPLYLDTVEIQLEEGVNVTPYEPYTTIHNYINLTQPLPSLPDGTADELIIKDGHAKIVQNIVKMMLDGSENWFYYSSGKYFYDNTKLKDLPRSEIGKVAIPFLSPSFSYINAVNPPSNKDNVLLLVQQPDRANEVNLKMTSIGTSVSDLKAYLNENPIEVYRPLAQPVEIDLGEVSIKTIDGNDYLYITDPIKSDMYAKYIRNTTLNDVYYTKTETNSQIKIVKDEIDLAVDRIDDLTPFIDSKTGSNYLHLEKTFASEGAIRSLSIKGFTLFPLYPGMSYPSNTQYPGANSCYKLYFDTVYPVSSTKKTVEIMSPIPLQTATISGVKIQDELLIENNKISVIQNLSYNSSNQLVKLSQSIIHDLGELPIPTLPYDTYITVENYNNDTLSFECKYLQANPYTDIFATQSEMSAKLSITDSNINSKVSKNNIISEINQSAEEVSIDASKITLSGYTSINDSFSVDEQGNFSVESPSSGIYDYNIFDLRTVYAIIQDKINVDSALLNVLDTDDSGNITSVDYVKIYKYLDGSGTLQKNVTSSFEFDPTNPKYCIAVKNSGLITASMGSGGINANIANIENLICCKAGNSVSMVNDPLLTINGSTAEMFAQVGQIFSKVKPGEIIVKDTSGYQTVSTITPNGIVTPTVTQTSREENKKNFEIFNNALEIIDDIDLYKYNLITENDNHKKHIGFVIGKNYKYSSEITAVDNEGKEIGVDNYSMTSLCLQAIKEQQEIIKQLQNEIKDLKERIDK